jgi:ureidoacrylate peracid hydrolase
MNPALLVIDMQNDFVGEGGVLEVQNIRDNIGKYKNFIDRVRETGSPIIFTRHGFDPEKNPQESKKSFKLREKGLRKGSDGWQIFEELKPQEGDIIIDKNRFDAFFGTDLNNILRERKIDTVIVTGTMTEICCESTARSAMFYDYNMIFCSDLTFSSNKENQKNTLEVMEKHFGEVKSSEEILIILSIK